MAAKKPTKSAKNAELTKVLSDKEIVKKKFKNARVEKIKDKFFILDKKDGEQIFTGLADSESNAWKRAAHECI